MAKGTLRAFSRNGVSVVLTLSVAGLIAIPWFGYRSTMAGINQAESAYAARRGVLVVLNDLLDQETSVRGYTSTMQRAYLEPYSAARSTFETDLRVALHESATAQGMTIEPSLLDIEPSYQQWLDRIALPLIAQPNRRDASVLQLQGKTLMGRMRADLAHALNALDALTATYSSRTKERLSLGAKLAVLIGLALFAVIVVMVRVQKRTAGERDDQEQLAFHDALTGLPNRISFLAHTARALSVAHRLHTELVIILFDLNEFKGVNDLYGHAAGDALLRAIAQRVRYALRESDLVARLGGDEFTILLQAPRGTLDVDILIRKILESVSEPHFLRGQTVRVTASIGVARYPRDGDTTESLLACADGAMYRAKRLHAALPLGVVKAL